MGDSEHAEQLWCAELGNNRFGLCCIPFYLYGVSLGDVIRVKQSDCGLYEVIEVEESFGFYTYRVFFYGETQYKVMARMDELGAGYEWYSTRFMAIAVGDLRTANNVTDYLSLLEKNGELEFESAL